MHNSPTQWRYGPMAGIQFERGERGEPVHLPTCSSKAPIMQVTEGEHNPNERAAELPAPRHEPAEIDGVTHGEGTYIMLRLCDESRLRYLSVVCLFGWRLHGTFKKLPWLISEIRQCA